MSNLPFLHIDTDPAGNLKVSSNVQVRLILLGMLEEAKVVLLTGHQQQESAILPANGNAVTDRFLKEQGR